MNNVYIPAPAGEQLVTWHPDNGLKVLPLIGWLMYSHGVGEPIIREGLGVRVPRYDEATYTELVTPETAPSFDPERWAALAASTFETAVQNHIAALENAMATDGRADVSNGHASHEAANRLVTTGRAQWDGRGYDRITPC